MSDTGAVRRSRPDPIGVRQPARNAPYAVIGLGVVLMVGLFMLMVQGDEERVYRQLGHRIQEVKYQQFDAFWSCALGADGPALKNNADLGQHVLVAVARDRRYWGLHVQEECLPLLEDVANDLSVLIAPDTIKPQLEVMVDSAERLKRELQRFSAHVASGEATEASVRRGSNRIARPWYEFLKAHGELSAILRAKRDASDHD